MKSTLFTDDWLPPFFRASVREIAGANPCRTNTQGFNWAGSAAFLILSANG